MQKGEQIMGRKAGFWLGLLGFVLPGFFQYVTYDTTTILRFQGFFYDIVYGTTSGGRNLGISYINRQWISLEHFPSLLENYLFLASMAIAVLGLIIILGSRKKGSIVLLIAGITNICLMLIKDFPINGGSDPVSIIPIPVGAIILILAGFLGLRDDSTSYHTYVKE